MPMHHLYYHLVWATKEREPLITPALESDVYRFISLKAHELGAKIFAVGGIPDHVHMVTTIPASLAVAQFIGKVKGSSSRQTGLITPFRWQTEYGSYSVSRSHLEKVIAYVRNQKAHHTEGTTIPILEQWT